MAKKSIKTTPTSTQVELQNPGMTQVTSFAVLFIINTIVLYFANSWYPMNVVLGTFSISPMWSLLLSAGSLAIVNTLSIPFFHEWELRRNRPLTSAEWMAGYLVINFVTIWLITRASEVFGMGVTSWGVVLSLAVVLDIIQGIGMMKLEAMRKK